MTIEHPHPYPEDEWPDERHPSIATVPDSSVSDTIVDAARDMQTMHTRLADLLDQVSVAEQPDSEILPPVNNGAVNNGAVNSGIEHVETMEQAISHNNSYGSEPLPSFFDNVAESSNERPSRINTTADTLDVDVNDAKTRDFETNSTWVAQPEQNDVSSFSTPFGSTEPNDDAYTHNTTGFFSRDRNEQGSDVMSEEMTNLSQSAASFQSDYASGLTSEPKTEAIDSHQPIDNVGNGHNSESTAASSPNSAITIKGRSDGIAIGIGAGSWRMLMVQLRQRLHQSSGFFRGGTVSLDVGNRSLTEDELAAAQEVLNEHGLNLALIRSTSEETSQVAGASGITVTLAQAEPSSSEAASTNHEELSHFVYRGNLRSGQILRRSETVLVLGDVNPGALVESEGDILVWGRLRGIAHAGSTGDLKAIISAMLMEPTQLRISDSIAVMPSGEDRPSLFGAKKRNPDLAPRPEVAYITDGTIVVEPWDESKPGGVMAFRRL